MCQVERNRNFVLIPLLIISLSFHGCIRYRPDPSDRSSFMERAQTQSRGKVTATVTVLSDKESKKIFGTPLAKKGIQPVWVEIQNEDDIPYIFIPRNMDPNYYSAEEASYMAHFKQSKQLLRAGVLAIFFFPALALIPVNFVAVHYANKKMDSIFNEISMRSYIVMPREKNNGFVFTSVDQGTKHVTVDLIGNNKHELFDFIITVPGIKPDYTTKDYAARYPDKEIKDCNDEEFLRALDELPCCTMDQKGKKFGDPFNLIIIGELEDLVNLFTSARWDETQALSFSSGISMAKAFFTGENDRYSPVSPLYYDGHPQDIAFQKTRDNINQRLHFRLWYTPIRYHSKPVWIGAISRDIGVKFTFKTWYLTTHKIDPNLDDSRDYLLADMIEIEKVSRYGFINNTALIRSTHPKKNLTNDPYFTDNNRLVIELSTEDVIPSVFSWNQLTFKKDA